MMLSTPHGFHGKSTFMSRHTPFSPICHTPILPIYHRHLCMTHPVFPICHTLFFLYITPHMTQPVFSPYVTPHPSYISRTLIYETARFPHMSHTPSCLYVTAPYNHHTYSPPPPPPRRAIQTAWLVMSEMDCLWLPIHKSWRLNERMYGALTGLSKKKTRAQYGERQFKKWRRSYDTKPPAISSFSSHYPGLNTLRYGWGGVGGGG